MSNEDTYEMNVGDTTGQMPTGGMIENRMYTMFTDEIIGVLSSEEFQNGEETVARREETTQKLRFLADLPNVLGLEGEWVLAGPISLVQGNQMIDMFEKKSLLLAEMAERVEGSLGDMVFHGFPGTDESLLISYPIRNYCAEVICALDSEFKGIVHRLGGRRQRFFPGASQLHYVRTIDLTEEEEEVELTPYERAVQIQQNLTEAYNAQMQIARGG